MYHYQQRFCMFLPGRVSEGAALMLVVLAFPWKQEPV